MKKASLYMTMLKQDLEYNEENGIHRHNTVILTG